MTWGPKIFILNRIRIRNNARKNKKLKIINSVKNIIGVLRLNTGILHLRSINDNSRGIAKEIQICERICTAYHIICQCFVA